MKQQTQKREYSFGLKTNRSMFQKGMVDGIPIAMGYLAVSFSLGILAKKAGLGPFESFLASILNNASAALIYWWRQCFFCAHARKPRLNHNGKCQIWIDTGIR